MKIRIHEENHKSLTELQKIVKIILTRGEQDQLKTIFCKGKGWSLDFPHTVNVHSITLTGNYKWVPKSNVEFPIEIEEDERPEQ